MCVSGGITSGVRGEVGFEASCQFSNASRSISNAQCVSTTTADVMCLTVHALTRVQCTEEGVVIADVKGALEVRAAAVGEKVSGSQVHSSRGSGAVGQLLLLLCFSCCYGCGADVQPH